MNDPGCRTQWESIFSIVFKARTSRRVLRALIREDECAVGYDRNSVRAKAKIWLVDHEPSLAAAERLLARDHFGYLLPIGWGGA